MHAVVGHLNIAYLRGISLERLNKSYVVCSNHFRDDHDKNGRIEISAVPDSGNGSSCKINLLALYYRYM